MNKAELVEAIVEQTRANKKDVDAILSAATSVIMTMVSHGEKVTLVGFGSFETRDRQAREGRNPKTGERLTIPASKVPAFSAGKPFKEKVAVH
jgi:DNA-binding protein HU-beta